MRFVRNCWLSPLVSVQPSPIHGEGLFAAQAIDEGEVVVRTSWKMIDDKPPESMPAYRAVFWDRDNQAKGHDYPVPKANHSCDPNLWHLDAINIAARRAIAAGEELTLDYATHTDSEIWTMECLCGAPACRGLITGLDWRKATLRETYGHHWTPGLWNRIEADE